MGVSARRGNEWASYADGEHGSRQVRMGSFKEQAQKGQFIIDRTDRRIREFREQMREFEKRSREQENPDGEWTAEHRTPAETARDRRILELIAKLNDPTRSDDDKQLDMIELRRLRGEPGWSIAFGPGGIGEICLGGTAGVGVLNEVHGTAEARYRAQRNWREARRLLSPVKPKYERHHSDPEFMGGNKDQPLTRMEKKDHRYLHADLNEFVREQRDASGNNMAPRRGNSGKTIRSNFSPEERLRAMADFYKKYREWYPDAAWDFFKQHPELK